MSKFVFGISFAVGNFIQMILMWFSLKKFLSLKFSLILFDYLKIVFASFMMGVVIFVLNIYFKDTDTIQNEDQGKSFTAHVSISSQMAT